MVSPARDINAPIHEPQVYIGLPKYSNAVKESPGSSRDSLSTEEDVELHPGACFASLHDLPLEDLMLEGPLGQDLRLRTLEGSTIVFFGAGYRGKRFVYERAAQLGVEVVIIEEPDSWVSELVSAGVVSKYIQVDINQHDQEAIFQESLSAIRALDKLDGLCTMFELSVSVVSRLCEAMNLPGSSVAAVSKARDKHATRECLEEANLPSIKNMLITSEADLEPAATHVGFPAVLKPVSGAASLGVKKVNNRGELDVIFAETVKLFSDMVLHNGDFVHCAEDSEHTVEFGSLMLEEYMDGPEVDIDLVVSKGGNCTYASVHDNGPTKEPYFAETWDVLPSLLPEKMQDELANMAIDSVKALGFDQGIFHVEGKYTSRGPRLIEINARMGGGTVRMMHKEANGVDLVDEQLLLAAGIPSLPAMLPMSKRKAVACATINAMRSGSISDLTFARQWDNLPGVEVVCNDTLIVEDEAIVGPEEGQPTWLADIVFKAPIKDLKLVGELALRLDVDAAEEFTKHYN